MRSLFFQIYYWGICGLFGIIGFPLVLWPTPGPLRWWVAHLSTVLEFGLRWIGGVKIIVRGKEHLPDGPAIIAAKHQCWGDGHFMYAQLSHLRFVIGDHVLAFPLVGTIIRKMGAIIVQKKAGAVKRARAVEEQLAAAHEPNQRILIYPEGHLAPIGHHYRYRPGVYFLHKETGLPVVPAATNLGQSWTPNNWKITPGEVVIEFLPPMPEGLEKSAFMNELLTRIETKCHQLIGTKMISDQSIQDTLLPDPVDEPTDKKAKQGETTA